jgi:hypothetical protein
MKSAGKRFEVAFDSLVEIKGLDLVQLGQVSVKHDLQASDEVNSPLDELEGYWHSASRSGFVGHLNVEG